MPMSAVERMRKYRERIKNDPEKRAVTLHKDRERWKQRRQENKVKVIDQLTDRGKRNRRKAWRKAWEKAATKNRETNFFFKCWET